MTRVPRWRGGVGAAAFLVAVGIAARNASLVLAAAIPLSYVAYGAIATTEVPEGLSLTRTVEASPVPPGEQVTIRLEVTNETDRTLSDVRVVDAVPDPLAVIDGSPRVVAALAPNETETMEYLVPAKRGHFRFDDPEVRVRSVTAGAAATARVDAAGDERLVCRLDADAPPIADQGDRHAGPLTTEDPGHGLEFHSIREYHPDDPATRIDWRHYAKRGDLATVNYRERLSASVVLVVDARPATRVVSGPGRPRAVELGAYAAMRAFSDLDGTGHEVAVAVVGVDGDGPDGVHWLPPNGGRRQRALALEAFQMATESDCESADAAAQVRRVSQLAPPKSQLLWFSPLLDDAAADFVETWNALGLPVSVLATDVLTHNTVSGQFAAIERHNRLARCQSTGARAVDWRRGTPLPVALSYAFAAEARTGGEPVRPGGGA